MTSIDVEFLFDNQLISEVENLIKNAKNHLLLISPFIDLDKRIQDALREKQSRHDFELLVLFGKNEDNIYKSIKKDSIEFLKQFPNVEIRFNERLHAKFYQNDFDFIMTSLNLYDYSLAKNIEVGLICRHASKGLLGKVFDNTADLIDQGVDKVKQDVLGYDKDLDPIEKFKQIFQNSDLKYKTEPITAEKDGLKGLFGGKKLDGFKVIVDELISGSEKLPVKKDVSVNKLDSNLNSSSKVVSASQLSKSLGVSQTEIIGVMVKYGYIEGDKITNSGMSKGLVLKNYMGKAYIAYPENLQELLELKK